MYLNSLCISHYLCIVGSVFCVLVVVVYWYRCRSACAKKIKKKERNKKRKKKEEVALDILKGPLPPEETVATRTYIKQSATNCLQYLTTNERLIQSVIKNC